MWKKRSKKNRIDSLAVNPHLPIKLILAGFFLFGTVSCANPGPKSENLSSNPYQRKSYQIALEELPEALQISYMVAGDPRGQRVVFVHGTPGNADDWHQYLMNVPKGLEYVAVDRPGFGQSEPEEALTSFSLQIDAIAPLFVEREGKKTLLVGHSMGGTLAFLAAIRHPGKLAGILVLAGAIDPELEEVLWIQKVGRTIDFLLPRELANSNRELIAYKNQLLTFVGKLNRIKLLTTVIHGTDDSLVPYANVEFMRKNLTASKMSVISLKDAGHFLPWKHKKEIDSVLNKLTAIGR